MLLLGLKQLQDPYYQGVTAQVAFFFVLSIFPTIILMSQVLGYIDISFDNIGSYFELDIAPEVFATIQSVFNFESQTSVNIIFFIAAIWAASRLHFTLLRVTNYTMSDGKDTGIFIRDRWRSIVTMFMTIITMVFSIIVLVYGQLIITFLADKLLIRKAFDVAWRYLRWPVAGGLYLLIVSFNYYVLPNNRQKYREVLPGSIFCAVGMLIVTIVYSYYTSYVVNNNILYGSMASLAGLMFWFYFISWVIVLGIFFNKVWRDTKEDKLPSDKQ